MTAISCQRDYSKRSELIFDANCINKLLPKVAERQWYKMSMEVYDNYVSGLLLVKKVETNSLRFILMSETGIRFFDMEQLIDGTFRTHSIIQDLNKKAIISTLQNDLQFLGYLPKKIVRVFKQDLSLYYQSKQGKNYFYLMSDENCSNIIRMESGSDKKRKVICNYFQENDKTLDSIHIKHLNLKMEISFKRFENE